MKKTVRTHKQRASAKFLPWWTWNWSIVLSIRTRIRKALSRYKSSYAAYRRIIQADKSLKNLLSTADTPSTRSGVKVPLPRSRMSGQLKNQPWSEDENLIAYVPMLEVVRSDRQTIGFGWKSSRGRWFFRSTCLVTWKDNFRMVSWRWKHEHPFPISCRPDKSRC